jgi:hypothetical protein
MSGLRYFIDPLPGDLAQCVCDVLDGDRVVQSWLVGSPGPRESVRRWIEQQEAAGSNP